MNSLTIVPGDNEKQYAAYLQQLISAFDDKDDKQVGTKDGEVKASIWCEKEYESSLSKIASSQHILFIGNSKLAKERRSTMSSKFDRDGMHYGWLGSQGYMYVDDLSLNKNNYPDFMMLCEKYGRSFERKLNYGTPTEKVDTSEDIELLDGDKPRAGATDTAGRIALAGIADPAIPLIGLAAAEGLLLGGGIAFASLAVVAAEKGSELLQAGEAMKQQYNLLTLILYTDGLSEFLGA